jgi:hypothetical protein
MSIALKVAVKPSFLLRTMVLLMLLVAGMLAVWLLAGPDHILAQQRLRAVITSCGLLLAVALAWLLARFRSPALWQTCVLEVVTDGQMFLAWQDGVRTQVAMLAGSTLWRHCMMLRLREVVWDEADTGGAGACHTVAILPDSVSGEERRALMVACRWLQARAGSVDPQKIL